MYIQYDYKTVNELDREDISQEIQIRTFMNKKWNYKYIKIQYLRDSFLGFKQYNRILFSEYELNNSENFLLEVETNLITKINNHISIRQFLPYLNKTEQKIFEMYISGYNSDEIAKKLNVKKESVWTMKTMAINKLKEIVRKETQNA